MPEETPTVETPVTPEQSTQPEAPEVKDPMIPKSRFDEINNRAKELADRLAKYEKEEQERTVLEAEAERKRAEEQGKFEELYRTAEQELEKANSYKTRAEQLEAKIQTLVDQKIEAIGNEYADLIPEGMTAEAKLEWINKAEAKGLFGKKEVPSIGDRKADDSGKPPKINLEKVSPFDKIKMGLGK